MRLFRKKPKNTSTTNEIVEERPTIPPQLQNEITTSKSTFEGMPLPDWSSAQLSIQRPRVADQPPDLETLIRESIKRAGKGSPKVALERLYTMLGTQIDAYALKFPHLSNYDFKAIRRELFARPDFNGSMLFSSLTYFGTTGVAMNNQLIEQVPLYIEALEDASRQGHMNEDNVYTGLISDNELDETSLPNWSTDPLTIQEPHIAKDPPDLNTLAQQAIERAGRGALREALPGLYSEVGRQIDLHTAEDPRLQEHDFKAIRHKLLLRSDFDTSMLFSSLTYFGEPGIAINNLLVDSMPEMMEAFEDAARKGNFDEQASSHKDFHETLLPDWSYDPIIVQKPHLAEEPPDLRTLALLVIEQAGRGSPVEALLRFYNVICAQIDDMASMHPELQGQDLKAIRDILFERQDFEDSMLFSSLTYFGVPGIAINNQLVQRIPTYFELIADAAREGYLDGEHADSSSEYG